MQDLDTVDHRLKGEKKLFNAFVFPQGTGKLSQMPLKATSGGFDKYNFGKGKKNLITQAHSLSLLEVSNTRLKDLLLTKNAQTFGSDSQLLNAGNPEQRQINCTPSFSTGNQRF